MRKFYHLHVWASGDFDSNTKIVDRSVHPFIVEDVGLEIDEWPADEMFYIWPEYFATDRLRSKLQYWGYTGIKFNEVFRMRKGSNFRSNYPTSELPQSWWLKIHGKAGEDDFGLFNRIYLVVSEKALIFLRDNNVTHAESNEIDCQLDEYFNSERKDFWI